MSQALLCPTYFKQTLRAHIMVNAQYVTKTLMHKVKA